MVINVDHEGNCAKGIFMGKNGFDAFFLELRKISVQVYSYPGSLYNLQSIKSAGQEYIHSTLHCNNSAILETRLIRARDCHFATFCSPPFHLILFFILGIDSRPPLQ